MWQRGNVSIDLITESLIPRRDPHPPANMAFLGPTKDDATVLAALGHKEELNRQFTPFSMAANAVITASAWV